MLNSFIMSKTTANKLVFKLMGSLTIKFNFLKVSSTANQFHSCQSYIEYILFLFTMLQALRTGSSCYKWYLRICSVCDIFTILTFP